MSLQKFRQRLDKETIINNLMTLFNKLFSQDTFQLIPDSRLAIRKSRLGEKNPPSPPFEDVKKLNFCRPPGENRGPVNL
jgi:hypothetical protein